MTPSHSSVFSKDGESMRINSMPRYACAVGRNEECDKSGCFINGGDCFSTRNYNYALVEPIRIGQWINDYCSFCGQEAITEWNDTGGEHIYTPRCPWCGAHMEKETVRV